MTQAATTLRKSDARRWQAVRDRDRGADGRFVFAVRTTGVYCRPSCPARRARRENVAFYDSPAAAEAAGFRPCRRCAPDRAGDAPHARAVIDACTAIRAAEEAPDLGALAAGAGLSPGHFQRVFKAQVGLTPKRYAMAVRKERLRAGLAEAATVTDAIYEAGYASASRAYADRPAPGLAPAQLRRGAAGETVRYAAAPTSLGEIVVAATGRGLCLVEFTGGAAPAELLRRRLPHARLEPAEAGLADWVAAVVARIDRPGEVAAALPLDIRGTAFQERVWRALTGIPAGATVSYAELAGSLGKPGAARAVAGACAANRLAVVVPCHRVVRGSGDLAGYRWGLERKRALIEREAEAKTATES
jgi:AraC family transcriptional regulator of adaptative response/methylated-DNA-[protein]-cysteine methyltransferase